VLPLLCAASLAGPQTEAPAGQKAPAQVAAEAPPSFAARVEQVVVDVVVTDRKGRPVTGLTRDDLIVKEDGVPQKILSFEAIALPEKPAPVAPPPPPARVSTNVSAPNTRGRAFVIVFDNLNMTPFRARDAKGAVASFLQDGVRPGDYVSLIATGDGTWWTGRMNEDREKLIDIIKRLDGRRHVDTSSDRMSDYEAMRIHLYHDPAVTQRVLRRYATYGVTQTGGRDLEHPFSDGADDPYLTARATQTYQEASARINATLEVLERALNGLATAPGRKSVILVSDGFIDDANIHRFRKVYEASRRANAVVYFLDTRGLEGLPADYTAQFGPPVADQDAGAIFAESIEASGGSESIAAETGGFTVKNTNDLAAGIQKIAEETRVYYLLGYVPANTARDGRFREIKVELRNPRGRKVRARKGYYAPSETSEEASSSTRRGIDPAFQAALDAPWTEDGIPMRMTAYLGGESTPGKATVHVVTEVDIRDFKLENVDGRYRGSIEFLLVVAHRQSGEYYRDDQTIDMNMLPSTRDRVFRTWLPIVRELDLKPGDHLAKMIVREVATGHVGSVVHEFEVPPLGEFRVSTPILSDTRAESSPGQPRPAFLARREFPRGAELLCQFDVFGASRDERGMPRVVQAGEVRRKNGPVYVRLPPTAIEPTSLGELSRVFGVTLDEAVPGDYEVVLTFRDELSGKSLELHEPFRVVPRLPPQAARSVTGG
jgi:VWFA-related protein